MTSRLSADLRFAFRSIWRRPAFSAVVIVTLGLGIAANTAMFGVVHATLIRPLPYEEPERLVLGRCTFDGRLNPWLSAPDYFDYREQADAFESFAALTGFTEKATITGGQTPERATTLLVTDNFFPVLGVRPVAGRWFTEEEGKPGGPDVVLVSEGFAMRWAGGPEEAIGRTLAVNGRSATVVGVMPATFRFVHDVDVWIPARRGEGYAGAARRFHNWLTVGRLRPGVSIDVARHQVDAISRWLQEQYPDSNTNKALRLDPLQTGLTGEERPSLLLLMGAVGMVLLIACANVAGLLLARGTGRRSELAVRASLGATKLQLVRQLLFESLVLSLVAGAVGVVAGTWLQKLLPVAIGLDHGAQVPSGMTWPVLGFAFALTLATGVLFGIVPALRGASANLSGGLAPNTRTTEGRGGARLRAVLAAGQVALSLFLLIGAGLLVRSFARLAATDPGFVTSNLLTGEIHLVREQYPEGWQRVSFFDELRRELAAIPAVEAAGVTSHLPIRNPYGNYRVWASDNRPGDPETASMADRRVVLPGYFDSVGIRLVAGRDIDSRDGGNARRVVVVNELMARRLFGERNPLGQVVMVDQGGEEPVPFEIIGVVKGARTNSLAHEPSLTMYQSYYQFPLQTMRLAIRTAGSPEPVTREVRRVVSSLAPDVPVESLVSMETLIDESIVSERATAASLTAFSLVAMTLAAIGLYGVLAYFVGQRTHEIGIRMSLGAGTAAVVWLVLSRALLIVGIGLVAGLAAALAGVRLLSQLLYQVEPTDAATFAGVSTGLLLVSLAASALPAWRAARIDPVRALRSE